MNPLIAIPSPRTIPEIVQALGQIKDYDKLWLKYMPEYMAYITMREKFLNHPSEKYTHLVICPDDLLIDDPNKLQILLDDYQYFNNDNTIISGYCNVDHGAFAEFANITTEEVSTIRPGRTYKWKSLYELKHYRDIRDQFPNINSHDTKYLIEVKFAGFPLFVIPRKIVERVKFRNDSPTGQFDTCGCCVDVMFCHDVIKNGCKIYVDTRVGLNHLKISDKETSKDLRDLPLQNSHFFIDYAEKKLINCP